MIRQPIVTICGHVDHGKTSLLDKIRGSSVAAAEAGGITQKISFTLFPADNIKKGCYLLDKYNVALQLPGLLFIDTPGHAAFTNLRKRGGNLADLAILVVDVNKGIEPQTAEVLQILKLNKVPFIIALNKIDNISGWKKNDEIKNSIESQALIAKQKFEERLFTFQAALSSYKLESDLFWNITDYTKKVAIVPCSAKTGEGIPELLMTLCGLAQKFLKKDLSLGEKAKGVILEIKKEKAQYWLEAILYDGKLKVGDEIAIASFNNPIIAKIRVIEEILPISNSFKNKQEVTAASGLRLQLADKKEILPGMPFVIYEGDIKQIEKEFKKEISSAIQTEKEGIVAKAESLGSVEALLTLLKEANISVSRAGIGNINKADIIAAKTSYESARENSLIVGFNVDIDEDAKALQGSTKIIQNEVVYKLIEDTIKFRDETRKQVEKEKLSELANLFKLEILHEYVFRNSNPAIFGVKILAGKLVSGIPVISRDGEEIGNIKAIQSEGKSVSEASSGELAISVTGVTFDRQLKDVQFLYSNLSERQFKAFKKHKELLTEDEKKILGEILEIKRKKDISWGRASSSE
jgi:translation initiation factor 5B